MTCLVQHQLRPARLKTLQASLPDGVSLVASDPDRPFLPRPGATGLIVGVAGWNLGPDSPVPDGWPGDIRWVHLGSTGIDRYPRWLLDMPHVTTSRGAQADAIAEYTLAAMLDFEKRLTEVRATAADRWKPRPLGMLSGKVLGLVGFGAIGSAIARRALPFGMEVRALRRTDRPMDPPEVGRATLAQLLAEAHHLVLCAPLTDETRRMIDTAALQGVRPGLHLVNVGRGGLVDETALRAALDDGRIARATLDVTDPEPPEDGSWLYDHPAVVLTPHLSWNAPATEAESDAILRHNLGCWARQAPDRMRAILPPGSDY